MGEHFPSSDEDPTEAVRRANVEAAFYASEQDWQSLEDAKNNEAYRQMIFKAIGEKAVSDAEIRFDPNNANNPVSQAEFITQSAADPQSTESYLAAEGFDDPLSEIFDDIPSQDEAARRLQAMDAPGVRPNHDGTYTLTWDQDSSFDSLANGEPAYEPGDPQLN